MYLFMMLLQSTPDNFNFMGNRKRFKLSEGRVIEVKII